MTECVSAEMRDALPDMIHGNLDAAIASSVEAHVASCTGCAAELALLRAVVASAPRSPELDLNRIVAALPKPSRQGLLLHRGGGKSSLSIGPPSFWSRPVIRVAAAVAVVTAGALSLVVGRDALNPERQARPAMVAVSDPVAAAAPVQVPSQTPATVAERPPAPAARQASAAVGLSLVGGEVHDLSDERLATLLNDMDQLDPIPGAEPEAISPVISGSDGSGIDQ